MKILVIDAQGGGLGRQLIIEIRQQLPEAHIMAVGTNSMATAAMLRAGADEAATGENPVVVASRRADVIVGPIGIVLADAMLGEVTEKMALAVAKSGAEKVLIPFNQCGTVIVGAAGSANELIGKAVNEVKRIAGG